MNKYLKIRNYIKFIKRSAIYFLRLMPIARKNYRLRNRIEIIKEASDLILENQNNLDLRGFDIKVEKKLSRLGIMFNSLPEDQKSNLFSIFAKKSLHSEVYCELKHKMLETPAELLSCRQWLNLHEICCYRGRYTLGQVFREKARTLAIKPLEGSSFKPPINWENTIGAAIEGGECNRLEDLELLLARAGIVGNESSKWKLYLSVLNGLDISNEYLNLFDKSDFADYLTDKTVAIVGPAPTEALDAEEIDRHNLVVRLNYSYEGKGIDRQHKGLRTDISCFNSDQIECFINEYDGKLPGDVAWGCFRSSEIFSLNKKINKPNYRMLVTFYEQQFHDGFNTMTTVALDHALFKTKKIKIYHTDLMLTVIRQSGYYPESHGSQANSIAARREIFLESSISLDPVLQFRVFYKLWRNQKITGDDIFVKLLEGGLDAYLRDIERVYADYN